MYLLACEGQTQTDSTKCLKSLNQFMSLINLAGSFILLSDYFPAERFRCNYLKDSKKKGVK